MTKHRRQLEKSAAPRWAREAKAAFDRGDLALADRIAVAAGANTEAPRTLGELGRGMDATAFLQAGNVPGSDARPGLFAAKVIPSRHYDPEYLRRRMESRAAVDAALGADGAALYGRYITADRKAGIEYQELLLHDATAQDRQALQRLEGRKFNGLPLWDINDHAGNIRRNRAGIAKVLDAQLGDPNSVGMPVTEPILAHPSALLAGAANEVKDGASSTILLPAAVSGRKYGRVLVGGLLAAALAGGIYAAARKKKRPLEKTAVGFARLASIVGKDRHPLFHMTSLENLNGIKASGRLMSSGEAAARGLVKDVEGGGAFGRTTLPSDPPRYRVNISGDSASVPVGDLAHRRLDKPGALARASMPGAVGEYGRASLNSGHYNPSKNWDTISFSPEPELSYGPVGLLTGSHRIKGALRRNHPYTEVQASSTPRFDEDGLIEAVDLPSATGAVVYDPRATPREVAKSLKASGAVPINARLRRRLAAVSRGAGQVPATDVESGNISYDAISKMPEYGRLEGLAKTRLGVEKTADKNNPGKVTKLRKAPKSNLEGFAPVAYVKGTAKKSYLVGVQDGKSWRCTCPDWSYRGSKSGTPCKHIRLVQDRKERKRVVKTAATRYDKEVASGRLDYSRLMPRDVVHAVGTPTEAVKRDVREHLSRPSAAPNLPRLRRIRELSIGPAARDATNRLGYDVDLSAPASWQGRGGSFDRLDSSAPVIRVPTTAGADFSERWDQAMSPGQDGAARRAVLAHEIGEAEHLKSGKIAPFATHLGTRPNVRERLLAVGDPDLTDDIEHVRRYGDPDDTLVWKKMKQVGATADAPIPLAGKQHRALDRWVANSAHKLSPDARAKAVTLLSQGVTASYIPRPLKADAYDLQVESALDETYNPERHKKFISAVKDWVTSGKYIRLAKTAATRYDKEVARGNISYTDIAKRVPDLTVLDPRGADRSDIRRALEAPSTAPNLGRLRRIRELSVRPAAREAALRDGTTFDLPHGPEAVAQGAYARPAREDAPMGRTLTGKYEVHVPMRGDGTTRGALDHEIAETREQRRAGLRPIATHDGTGPLVAERTNIVGDPAAFGEISKMRTGRGADPDDKLLWRKMKQMGATADRPMPMGGKAHRSLDRWVDRNADMLAPESRKRALFLARDFGEGVDPRDISPYLPGRVRELIASHDADPHSIDFDDPSHPKYPEVREIENWGTAKPRQQRVSLSLALSPKAPNKAQLAAALADRPTATGSKLRTLLRAVRAGAL